MQKAAAKLQQIQSELVANKNLFNSFGGYSYRSTESILEALKPHLEKHKAILTLNDEMIAVLDRVYVKATATFFAEGETITVSAFAREPLDKKGMDSSQITGACSSYARKYACNGLFCIDDAKDADATNDHGKSAPEPTKPEPAKSGLIKEESMVDKIVASFWQQTTLEGLNAKMDKAKTTAYGNDPKVVAAYDELKAKL